MTGLEKQNKIMLDKNDAIFLIRSAAKNYKNAWKAPQNIKNLADIQ